MRDYRKEKLKDVEIEYFDICATQKVPRYQQDYLDKRLSAYATLMTVHKESIGFKDWLSQQTQEVIVWKRQFIYQFNVHSK